MEFLKDATHGVAVADFYAGQMESFWGDLQIKANLEACMTSDDVFFDSVDDYVNIFREGTYTKLESVVVNWGDLLNTDLVDCMSDEVVYDAFQRTAYEWNHFQGSITNVVDIIKNNFVTNEVSIKNFGQQLVQAWDAGLYYNAGQVNGVIFTFLLWNPNEPTY